MELRDNNLEFKKNEIINKNIPIALIVIFLSSLTIYWFLLNRVPKFLLSIWFITICFLISIRLTVFVLYKFNMRVKTYKYIKTVFYILLFLNSLSLGMSNYFIFFLNEKWLQVTIVFILAGLALGSLSTISVRISYVLTYVLLTIVPTFITFLIIDKPFYKYFSIMVLIYILYLCFTAIKINRIIIGGLETKIKYENAIGDLKISEERFSTIFNEAPVGIFYYSRDLKIIEFNETFSEIFKIPIKLLNDFDLNSITDKRGLPAILMVLKGEEGFYEGEYITKFSNRSVWIVLRTAPIEDKSGNIIGGVGIVEDFTKIRKMQKKLDYRYLHDVLTDLPNRTLFSDRLNMALLRAKRRRHIGAVFFLDLDRFKTINDTLGHKIGDQIIKKVSERIKNVIRNEDTLSRHGGDEFAILLPELSGNISEAIIQAKIVAGKLSDSLKKPFDINGQLLHTSASIGIALFPMLEDTSDDILKHSDVAMYRAKKDANLNICFYDMEVNEITKKRLNLEKDLRKAVDNNEFENYYQPIVETKSGKIIGAEILIRWNHPEFGFVVPDEFIDIAEETRLIIPMGKWSLENIINQMKIWNNTELKKLHHIGFNLSIKQFRDEDLFSEMVNLLSSNPEIAKKLILEFTESIMIENYEKTIEKMNKLKSYGLKFAIDDFGTGYSSLSYLKKLPIDVLKIDRIFIMDVLDDPDDAAITRTMIDIGSHFNLDLIAEGVETKGHVDYLKKNNCQYYQGYYCSKPIKKDEFEKLVLENYKNFSGE